MAEPSVDPNYEYEAPQFYDFNGQSEEEQHIDSWFDDKPDDEGGVRITEDVIQIVKHEKEDSALQEDKEAHNNEKIKPEENAIAQGNLEDGNLNQGREAGPLEQNRGGSNNEEMKPEIKVMEQETSEDGIVKRGRGDCTLQEKREASNGEGMKAEEKEIEEESPEETEKVVDENQNVNNDSGTDIESNRSSGHEAEDYLKAEDDSKMMTRAQKRNHALSVSALNGIPEKKTKETPQNSDEKSGNPKRSRSLSFKHGKKQPSLTVPVTPQCLKRQKTGKPAMIKLKTTEEMEMERIAKLRKKTRHHIKANESSMKKAISCTSYHPVRNNTDLTQPQEFHFETDKRVKTHPMSTRADDAEQEFLKSLRQHPPSPTWKNKSVTVPKPFNLSSGSNQTKRKHAAMEKDANVTDSYESMAYQVYKFQNTTPPRFRTMKQTNEPNVKTEPDEVEKSAPKLTCPKTPNLSTRSRARPVAEDVLSREQQEEKDAEAMKNYQFKARPFDRRIIECEGLFGVKKPEEQKQLTEPLPFIFESDERLETRKQEKVSQNQEEESVPFKAMPQPNFDKVFRPQLKHERTAPKPFSFEEKDKERWRKKESKIQDVYKEEEKLREFKAQLLPSDSPDTLPAVTSKSCTSIKPFSLNTENRGAIKAEKWIQKVKSELRDERKKTVFKANPNKVTNQAPFVPQKSQKALTEVSEFSLNTNRRAERREEIETFKKEREQVDEELRKQREAEREKEEKEAIALLRKQLVHKAQPIHKYKTVVVKPSDKPLTEPASPAWSEIKRRRTENYR